MRTTPTVRPADRDDLVVVAALSASVSPSSLVGMATDQVGEGVIRNHLSVYVASGGTVLVAELDGHVVGFLLSRSVGPYLFAVDPAYVIDALFVTPDTRRRGVGHSLVAGVAALAGEAGAPFVYASAPAGDRGMQRFLARLGFAPTAGHRVVSTATLMRRLAQEGSADPRRDARSHSRREATKAAIDDIIARRRRARAAGLPSGPVDLKAFQSHRDTEHRAS